MDKIINEIYINNTDEQDKKRFIATIFYMDNGKARYKTVKFGLKGAYTYLDGAPEEKRKNYILRHIVREDFNDPLTAGFWSRWFIWEERKKYLKKILKNIMKKSNIIIKDIYVDKNIKI